MPTSLSISPLLSDLSPARPSRVSSLPPRTLASLPQSLIKSRFIVISNAAFGSGNPNRVPASRSTTESKVLEASTASDVVREFYDGINRRDLGAVELLIGEDCVYEDLVFSRPFVGRKAIIDFFKKFTESMSTDLQFVIDDISNEDTSAIGVTWHLEWQGRPFPFSKGCSFYRLDILDRKRQIVYGRDCVEPATKPGETALVLIRAVTWILQRFPQLADKF